MPSIRTIPPSKLQWSAPLRLVGMCSPTPRVLTALLAIMTIGTAAPSYPNLAKYQAAVGSSTGYSFAADDFCTDGVVSNYHRWRSTSTSGQWLEISFPRPVTIASAHLYSGIQETSNSELWANFKFQYDNGGSWVDIPGGSKSGNTATETSIIFSQTATSTKFRLLNTESGSAVRSVRELALFGPNLVGGVEQGYPIGTDVTCNLAYRHPATASSISGSNYALNAVDGFVDDSSRWLCATGTAGETLEVDLLAGNSNGDAYQAIGSAHVYTGDFATNTNALSAFTLEYWDTVNSLWATIPGAAITGNTNNIKVITFSSTVVTNKVRLVNNTTTAAKVAELQIFPPRSGGYPVGQNIRTEAPPTAAWSDFSDATHQLRVSSAGLKLGLSGNNAVFTNDSAGSDALNWQILLNHRDGSYRIRNVKTGKCLALAQISTAANTLVVAETYSGMAHQCWWLDRINATQFRLLNVWSGLALQSLGGSTTPGASLAVVTPGASALQLWDAMWQSNHSKKGIAATGNTFTDVPTETWMSYLYGKYQHTSWSYSWGRSDEFPYLAADHTFNPMQWGNNAASFSHGSSSSAMPIEGSRVYLQSQAKPAHLLGFNEPDGAKQANMTVAEAVQRWPRLQSMDAPLVGPCPANATSAWNADFYAAVNQQGFRVDYTPNHWYANPNSSSLINKIKEVYNLYGRPVWMTEFSCVRWSGTATWTYADTYNFLAEFMWRAENTPELARYALFSWKAEPTDPTDPPEAPRGNALDVNGNLTPYGELYASWDCIAQILPQKAYHLHNKEQYQRMQSPASGDTLQFVTPDNSSAGTQWYLTAGTSPDTWRIRSTRDGRPLICTGGTSATMGALLPENTQGEWLLTPVVSGANHDGWYYLDHPLTNQRLKDNGDGTCSMVAITDTSHASKWRFIVPLVPEMSAVTDSLTMLANQQALIDVLANDGGRTGAPSIMSVDTPNFGTAVIENGKIRYTPPNGFSGTAQFSYTITDGVATDSATVFITVLFNTPPSVNAGADQMVLLDQVTPLDPVAGAYFEWDAATDTPGNATWTSTGSAAYDWTFDSGNQTPVSVSDARFARLSKAYAFPAAKDASNTTFDSYGSAQKATFEFVVDIDGTDGSIFETGGSGDGMQVDVVNGVLRGTVAESTPARVSYTLTPTDLGRFIHVVFVADNAANVVQLYVDGQLKDEQPWTLGEDWAGGDGGSLGGVSGSTPSGGSTTSFTGKLALFRFYKNTAFTSSNVTTNLNALIGGRASTVILNGTVNDLDGDSLTTTWQVVSGPGAVQIADPAAVDTTATFSTAGTYVLRLTASDPIATVSDDLTITALPVTPYNTWRVGTFAQAFSSSEPSGNSDSDRLTNLQEFAFGTDPTSPLTPRLSYVANGTTVGGTPIIEKSGATYRAVFARRKDYTAAGLTYTVHFSADLAAWQPGAGTLTRLSGDNADAIETISMDFPTSVPLQAGGSAPPKFFRIGVSMD